MKSVVGGNYGQVSPEYESDQIRMKPHHYHRTKNRRL